MAAKPSGESAPSHIRHRAPPREWRIRPGPPFDFARSIGFPEFQARLLYNRGVRSRSDAESFLAADARLTHDPFLLPDMREAIDRLRRAVGMGETIAVFGDFDVDGLTGAAIVMTALNELGARVVPYLPDRVSEGHGLNSLAVGSIRAQGVSTMVTVDCGTTSHAEIELAAALGIDTIVTDHHSLTGPPPEAAAVVNPRRAGSEYPYPELTGAGLAYKLVEALWADMERPPPEHLLEIAALGSIADVGPLTGENRRIVKRGIEMLNSTEHPGLDALIARVGLAKGKIDARSVAFTLAPRLNAAGRIGDARLSLRLLTAATKEQAEPLAERLEQENLRRREMSQLAFTQAMEQVERDGSSSDPIIFVEHSEWIPGILGLVAGRLSETFHRPVAALALGDETSRASVRSIPEFDVFQALALVENRLVRYGGHPAASGFTVLTQGLPGLKDEMRAVAARGLASANIAPVIEIECETAPATVDMANMDFVESLEPFGAGNPNPALMTRGMRVSEARAVGRENAHLKMRLVHDGRMWDAIAFKQGGRAVAAGDWVDVVYNVGLNDWGGITRIELRVLDFRPSGS